MKVSLTVLQPGKTDGKRVPITAPRFLIGRDEKCQLRPASPMVSKRHCLLLLRDNRFFVQDLGSTNGTFVNDRQITGEVELSNGDLLKIGPLCFGVSIEADAPVPSAAHSAPNSDPHSDAAPTNLEDSAADMLLEMLDAAEVTATIENSATDSTIMDMPLPAQAGDQPAAASESAAAAKKQKEAAKAAATGNTSTAAKAILDKHLRRPR